MELTARLAVLVACSAATGVLVMLLGTTASRSRTGRAAPFDGAHALPGLLPGALASFVVVAAGGALTGAGTPDLAPLPDGVVEVVRAAGIGLLCATGLLTVRVLRREPVVVTATSLVILAWAGAALALVSVLAAIGALAVALAFSIRLQPGP